MPHPPADKDYKKSTFALGCSICRSENLEKFKSAANLVSEVRLGENRRTQKEVEEEKRNKIKELLVNAIKIKNEKYALKRKEEIEE